jgi:hypothetical protein
MGYDDGMVDETRPGSFWDGRSLGEEPMVSRILCFKGGADSAEYETDHSGTSLPPRYPDSSLHSSSTYVHPVQL